MYVCLAPLRTEPRLHVLQAVAYASQCATWYITMRRPRITWHGPVGVRNAPVRRARVRLFVPVPPHKLGLVTRLTFGHVLGRTLASLVGFRLQQAFALRLAFKLRFAVSLRLVFVVGFEFWNLVYAVCRDMSPLPNCLEAEANWDLLGYVSGKDRTGGV